MTLLSVKLQTAYKLSFVIIAFLGFAFFAQIALAQPPNDECVNADEIFDGVTPYSNVGANSSLPGWACAQGGADIWYTYTATCTGDVRLETCNNGADPQTNYDSVLEIFDTDSCGEVDISSLECDDDDCSLQSGFIASLVAGQTYIIRVGGWSSAEGQGHLEIMPQENCVGPGPPPASSPIPTMSEWGLIATAGVLGLIGFFAIRRRRAAA